MLRYDTLLHAFCDFRAITVQGEKQELDDFKRG